MKLIRKPKFYETDRVLRSYVEKVVSDHHKLVETEVRICLRPKPIWLPKPLYNFIVSKMIYIKQSVK